MPVWQVTEAAGFRVEGESVCIAPGADLRPATALLARLQRLVDHRGHSGAAEFFPLPDDGTATGARSPFQVPAFDLQSRLLCQV